MRGGLWVAGGLLLLSGVIAFFLSRQYRQDLSATQDLVLGLIYFMEQHGGRLPVSQEEFLAAPFVQRLADGSVRVTAPPGTRFRPQTHGIPIRDLAPFAIRWGVDLGTLTLDERGKARDPAGQVVEIVRWPSSPQSGKGYTLVLLGAYRDLIAGGLASRPTDQPANVQP